jgi:hypothetical protein
MRAAAAQPKGQGARRIRARRSRSEIESAGKQRKAQPSGTRDAGSTIASATAMITKAIISLREYALLGHRGRGALHVGQPANRPRLTSSTIAMTMKITVFDASGRIP